MNINHASTQYGDILKLHYKKDRTLEDAKKENEARKQDPALDQMLYDADKADMLNEFSKAKQLMMKLARGENLTDEEKQFLNENYPEFSQSAEQAQVEAEKVKENLKNARNKDEKQAIIMQAASMINSLSENDTVYAAALSEAIKTAINDKQDTDDFYRRNYNNSKTKANFLDIRG